MVHVRESGVNYLHLSVCWVTGRYLKMWHFANSFTSFFMSNEPIHIGKQMKSETFRKRPFVQFGESTLIPEAEAAASNTSSYLSSMAEVGWGLALLLAEIAPEHQNEILTRGFEIGHSRIIAGYNYATDVQASRIMAACVVAHLHADADFQKLIDKAKKEYGKNK